MAASTSRHRQRLPSRQIALAAHPGTVTDEEPEHGHGGSGLRYSFAIKNASAAQEIGVDAVTGKVLENKAEGPDPDRSDITKRRRTLQTQDAQHANAGARR